MVSAIFAIGLVLIFLGLADLLLTILNYEGQGLISKPLQRFVWLCILMSTSALPTHLRRFLRTLGAPFMIIVTLAFWLGIEILGFAFVYYAGITRNQFVFSIPEVHRGFSDALYFSGVTLPTLGFGDIVPLSLFYRIAAAIEAIVGFAIMTLSLSYVLNLNRVIQQFRILASSLFYDTEKTGSAWTIIQSQVCNEHPENIYLYLRSLHRNLLDWHEYLHQFPIAFYFYSPRLFLSIPCTFQIIGNIIEILQFGLPSDHPIHNNPSLQSFRQGYTSIIKSLSRQFHLVTKQETTIMEFELFQTHYQEYPDNDKTMAEFLDIKNKTTILFDLKESTQQQLYSQYTDWLSFHDSVQRFVNSTQHYLGYNQKENPCSFQ